MANDVSGPPLLFLGDFPILAAVLAFLVVALGLGLRLLALGVIPENRRPSSGMAWLILILVQPVIGFTIFLLFGTTSVGKTRTQRQASALERVREHTKSLHAPDLPATAPAYLPSVLHLNRQLGAFPAVEAHGITLYPDYDESLAAMTAAVEAAQHWVHVAFYITAWDETTNAFFTALAAARKRGVTVRLLFDHIGSRGLSGYDEMLEKLDAADIDWHPMLPFEILKRNIRRPDLRNHRKILVIDGLVGFAGSQNMIEPGYHKEKNHKMGRKWVELTSRIEGALVSALDAVFATDWYTETGELLEGEVIPADPPPPYHGPDAVLGQVIPSGPGVVAENNLRAFTTLLYGATRRISLTSPYFVPDESLLYAVTTAAQRGVDVELFVGAAGDQFMVHHAQRSFYRALLEAGVKIYLYPAPLVLHSKHFSFDDDVVVLGSSNMDMRSFALNYEISVMFVGDAVMRRMREVEDGYRAVSRLLTLEEWEQRPWRQRYVDNVMRLTAALQ
jgi:cardiolipin synthase A/B